MPVVVGAMAVLTGVPRVRRAIAQRRSGETTRSPWARDAVDTKGIV